MSKLYSPPQWRNYQQIEGSLRYSVPTSFCTYRKAGVWTVTQSPGVGDITNIDTDSTTGVLLLFYTPTVIPDSLATLMQAANVAGTYV